MKRKTIKKLDEWIKLLRVSGINSKDKVREEMIRFKKELDK